MLWAIWARGQFFRACLDDACIRFQRVALCRWNVIGSHLGISEEFAHKTAGVLLTKPRSIRFFVWTAWPRMHYNFWT